VNIDYKNPDLLSTALVCVNKGMYVFPLEFGKKTPHLNFCPHWSKDSTNIKTKVEEWWGPDGDPRCNIGVDLGKSGLTVLDFDAGDPPPNLGLPATLTIRTGKGQHLYYRGTFPQGRMYFAGKHVGEIKSAGGYTVGPRSLHPSGKVYEPIDQSAIADLPVEIVKRLAEHPDGNREPVDASINGPKIPRGNHDNELNRISGKLRHLGMEEEAIYDALVEVVEKRCENYGSDYLDMCRKHAHNICKKPVGQDNSIALNQSSADPQTWRDYFRSTSQLEDGDVRMIIDGFLPEGVNLIGGLAGQGKTLFALSLVKSLTTGQRFLGKYQPQDIIPVVYLIPESSSRAFKMRCKAFRIPEDENLFLCRTVTEGKTLMLDDPILIEAVKNLRPVIVLDTLPRFNESGDENDASANKKLVDDITVLRAHGAIAVVALQHSTKSSAKEEMTLENVLRGTGDIGAMADSVYGLRRDRNLYENGKGPNEIEVRCVKPRDIKNPPEPFRVAATYKKEDGQIISYIDESGDFQLVDPRVETFVQNSAFLKAVTEDPAISRENLAAELGTSVRQVRTLAKKLGFTRTAGRFGKWIQKAELNSVTVN
jgi:hypothetical protein